MKRLFTHLMLGSGLSFIAGCVTTEQPQSFTLTADLPPDFVYVATASYVAAPGQHCNLGRRKVLKKFFNRKWRENYQPDSRIELTRTHSGCDMVLHRIELNIYARYGQDMDDIGTSFAGVAVRSTSAGPETNMFNSAGVSQFGGQCEWLFRTLGPKRYITKVLSCMDSGVPGDMMMGNPFAAYTMDQLPGKTVRLKLKLAEQERPFMEDTWIKVTDGWKRCMGQGFDVKDGYCRGDNKDFTTFHLSDERVCTIYPGCTERMKVMP